MPRLPALPLAVLLTVFHTAGSTAPAHAATPPPTQAPATLLLDAGPHDRVDTIVPVPWTHGPGTWDLVAPDGSRRVLQAASDQAWFIEPDLRRGGARRYSIVPQAPDTPPAAGCTATLNDDRVTLGCDGRPALSYLAGPGRLPRTGIAEAFRRGGYLHPVWTPSGRIITDDYPPNHVHHHGLWWAWTRTEFEGRQPDFWNMGQGRGRVDFDTLEAIESGPVLARFTARHRHTDLTARPPRVALRETWQVRLFGAGQRDGSHILDLVSEQECAGESPLHLPTYHYGGLGYRGPWAWNGADGVRYLDSAGVTNRIAANETRPRWCWMGAEVDHQVAGIVVLDHPGNFRAPQPVRVHPTEPYLSLAPSQLGPWTLHPGERYTSRHRILALDGEPDPARLEQLWRDFAVPPVARTD